jgi:cyclic pyranopterin monophosphate synthase
MASTFAKQSRSPEMFANWVVGTLGQDYSAVASLTELAARTPMAQFSHFDETGASRMVDVGGKNVTERIARAVAYVTLASETLELIRDGKILKGNVFEVARLAGIMASKRTSDLIPLCHPLPVDRAEVNFEIVDERTLKIEALVGVHGRTGVEMEALTAVSVVALTVYDMCKSSDRGITIGPIGLVEKTGGKSGTFRRELPGPPSV